MVNQNRKTVLIITYYWPPSGGAGVQRWLKTVKYLREYADGSTFASITGFYSVVYGATGIESEANSVLAGNDSRFFVDRLQQLFANREPKGGAIRLTIDPEAQVAAMKSLDGRTGAVVAIDPTTGAILASLVSLFFAMIFVKLH